jgi:hypothetical protein
LKENISCYDRVQALIRNPEFLRDYNAMTPEEKEYFIAYELTGKTPEQLKKLPPEYFWDEDFFHDFIVSQIGGRNEVKFDKNRSQDKDYISWYMRQFLREERYLHLELDLKAKKRDLLERVGMYIDKYLPYIDKPKTRNKPEKYTNKFAIWDMYKKDISFAKVAKQLKQKETTVRKAYFRAFELIMGEPYDPLKHNRKAISKDELKRTCDTCTERLTCKVLCPDVVAYANQDYGSRLGRFVKDKEFED